MSGLNPTLNTYLQQTQRFCADAAQKILDPIDLIDYVNRARRELAGRTQCIRVVTPISGPIATITVTKGGTGYAAADTLTISTPDSPGGAAPDPNGVQATAAITGLSPTGAILGVAVTNGGDGYFTPAVTVNTSTGSGASFSVQTVGLSVTNTNQEVYNFSAMNLTSFPGVGPIIAIRGVSIIYANYRYSLPYYPFTIYQAMIRQYPRQYYYVPTMWSQLGQGSGGSAFLYPIASQPYQMEWDSTCLPLELLTNQDVEAIPQPWTDAIPYFAAHLAFAELQNLNASMAFLKLYDEMVHRFSAYARPGRASNVYGRY